MSDTEDCHHGCSVMSPHTADETFDMETLVVYTTTDEIILADDGLPGSMSMDEIIGGPSNFFY